MSILVFGASGMTGSEVAFQALKKGHKVTAFVRDPAKLKVPVGSGGDDAGSPLKDDKLKIAQGSVLSEAEVNKAFEGGSVDAVVVALGGRTSQVGNTMLTDGTANIIKAMKAHNVKRIVVVTSIGCGDSYYQAPWFFRGLMATVMRTMFTDKNGQEALFLESSGAGHDLDWVLVRPGGLTNGKATGIVNVVKEGAGSIARADVASFLLSAATDKNFPYLKQSPGISSGGGVSWKKDPSTVPRDDL